MCALSRCPYFQVSTVTGFTVSAKLFVCIEYFISFTYAIIIIMCCNVCMGWSIKMPSRDTYLSDCESENCGKKYSCVRYLCL